MLDKLPDNVPQFTESNISGDALYDINNNPVEPEEKKATSNVAVLNPVQLSVNTDIRFRGEWEPETRYKQGDYVYLHERRPGFFYRCTVSGISQSKTYGKSDYYEPIWKYGQNVYDDRLIWRAVRLQDIDPDACALSDWTPTTTYHIGNAVRQESGKPIIFEDGTEVVFQLVEVITRHDWPRLPEKRMNDGTCEWETNLSIGYLLPEARLKEPTFYEFVQIMDYLNLHEKIYFNDFIHKYNDLLKVRAKSLKEIIAETGYNYVAELLNLEDKELITLVKYMNIISDLKGSKSGLEVVFNLLSIRYSMQEWWETNPKGTPHTWDLSIEVEIEKVVSDMISKLLIFTRNYVYPIIENFEITYKMNVAELAIVMAGFIDIELNSNAEKAALIASMGGFHEKEWEWDIDEPVSNYVLMAGYIDILYKLFYQSPKNPLLIRATGTISKTVIFKFFLGSIEYDKDEESEEEKQIKYKLEYIRDRIYNLQNLRWVNRIDINTSTLATLSLKRTFDTVERISSKITFSSILPATRNLHINGLLVVKDLNTFCIYQKISDIQDMSSMKLLYESYTGDENKNLWMTYTKTNTYDEWENITNKLVSNGLVFTDGPVIDNILNQKINNLSNRINTLIHLNWAINVVSDSVKLDSINNLGELLDTLHINGLLVIKDLNGNTVVYQKVTDNDLILLYECGSSLNNTWISYIKDNTMEEWNNLNDLLPDGGLVISTNNDSIEIEIIKKLTNIRKRINNITSTNIILRVQSDTIDASKINNISSIKDSLKLFGLLVIRDGDGSTAIYQKLNNNQLKMIYCYDNSKSTSEWMGYSNTSDIEVLNKISEKMPDNGIILVDKT